MTCVLLCNTEVIIRPHQTPATTLRMYAPAMRSGTTAMTGYNRDVVLSMRSAALRLTCSSMNGAKLVLLPVHDWNRLKCPTSIRKRRNRGRSNEVFGLVEVVVLIEVDFT